MEETTRHPLTLARLALGTTMEELVSGIRAATARRGLRSDTDEARVRKWQRGTTPNEESQTYIAEALGWPADIARPNDRPTWLPLAADGVIPPSDPTVLCPHRERPCEQRWTAAPS
ncbi:hypothetical protein [Streptomyces prasinus]